MSYVINRRGEREEVHFDRISDRIADLAKGLGIDHTKIAQKVIAGFSNGMSTYEIDTLAAECSAHMASHDPVYDTLAARIMVSNLHKQTPPTFSAAMQLLRKHYVHRDNTPAPMITDEVWKIVAANEDVLNAAIRHERDYQFAYFGFCTLMRSYLTKLTSASDDILKSACAIVERPQYLFMRVAIGIHGSDIPRVLETYDLMSQNVFIHASPTLFNAGTPNGQLSSCFLLQMKDDSIEGIYDTLKQCALISKNAGGIGFANSNIRAKGAYICGTNGQSNGLVPMLRVFNNTSRYVDQGGGKRKGAFSSYLEPWHADVKEWLALRRNTGADELRARDLFYGLWIPDLFMRRVKADNEWSFFCPKTCPGLDEVWGAEFDALYEKYEREGKATGKCSARELDAMISDSRTETGLPYRLYKDAANRKSNQQHLGTIKCSNLCTEIIQYVSKDEIAVCNLASIALPKFVVDKKFDFERFAHVVQVVVRNLDRVIDRTTYPLPEARTSNMKHRPMGMGVQGLADVFIMMRMPFDSPAARTLNRDIFETMYFAALTASCNLAQELGPHPSYPGSPVSRGILQFDMWHKEGDAVVSDARHPWSTLRAQIARHGVRNSLLVAPMPTATVSSILGNNECFEPYMSNLCVRRTLAGEFPIVNVHLVRDLKQRGLWTPAVRESLILNRGSVKDIACIPDVLKELYKTAWEISPRTVINLAADRGRFIDQSQSMNLFISTENRSKLTSIDFYAWEQGLKTGCYYLRTQPVVSAIQFTVDAELAESASVHAPTKEDDSPVPMQDGSPIFASARVPAVNGVETRSPSNEPLVCDREAGICTGCQ